MTGASGFVGRAVVRRLLAGGWAVDAVSRSPHAQDESSAAPSWHRVDLFDRVAVERLLESTRPTHLVHLAWAPNRDIYRAPENFGWVGAGAHLVSSFFESGGRRAVAAGSSAEYDWSSGVCRERTSRLGGGGAYGAAKRALAELFAGLCEQRARGSGGEVETGGAGGAWARIFFLFGPHEPAGRLVSSVTRALLAGEPVRCSEGGQVRDYLFVDDAADALVRLLESGVSGPVNIASGEGIRVRDLVGRLTLRTGGADRVEWGEPDANPFVVADVGRLRDELDWRPPVGLDAGIDRTIAWWREQVGPADAGA